MTKSGINFAHYYNNTDLRNLANANQNFNEYRVATIQFYVNDSVFSSWPIKDPSLLGPYQNVYGFETADGYNSNPIARTMNFMNAVVVGWPDYPRALFAEKFEKKFSYPEYAFAQKLYLFEPQGSRSLSNDGCMRPAKPIRLEEVYNLPLLSLFNVKFFISAVPIKSENLTLQPSPNMHTLHKLLCSTWQEKRSEFFSSGAIGRPLYIYQNHDVFPRYFTNAKVKWFKTPDELLKYMSSASLSDLKNAVALIKDPELMEIMSFVDNSKTKRIVRGKSVKADEWSFELVGNSPTILTVTNSFSPFWKAVSSDGRKLYVISTYHAFTGIVVPADVNKLTLYYSPPYRRFFDFLN